VVGFARELLKFEEGDDVVFLANEEEEMGGREKYGVLIHLNH
jgi:hypothetical protein